MNIEEARLDIERQKLALERHKVDLEIKKTRWLTVSVATPMIVALATIAYGFWSAQMQSRQQFKLEVAKSIMSGSTQSEVAWRANLFGTLFPDSLPTEFPKELTAEYDSKGVQAMLEFWRVMTSRGLSPKEAHELWILLFAKDTWATADALKTWASDLPKRE